MPASFSTVGGNTTYTLSVTKATAIMLASGDALSKSAWTHGHAQAGVDFATLTNQQKADLILAYTVEIWKDLARQQQIEDELLAARAQAIIDAGNEIDF